MKRKSITRRELLAWMPAASIAAFISRGGEAMQGPRNIKILFIAGFGPIVREAAKSRKLYGEALGIPFKEETEAISIRKLLGAQKVLPCGRFLRLRSPVLAKIPGLTIFLPHKRGLSLTWTALTKQPRSFNPKGIECSSRTRKNHGAKSSVVLSHRRDCCSALLSLLRCENRNSTRCENRIAR